MWIEKMRQEDGKRKQAGGRTVVKNDKMLFYHDGGVGIFLFFFVHSRTVCDSRWFVLQCYPLKLRTTLVLLSSFVCSSKFVGTNDSNTLRNASVWCVYLSLN